VAAIILTFAKLITSIPYFLQTIDLTAHRIKRELRGKCNFTEREGSWTIANKKGRGREGEKSNLTKWTRHTWG
jgi:hypothetical protein